MFAFFARRQSELAKRIEKGLPSRETSHLTLVDFSLLPSFSLAISPVEITPSILIDQGPNRLTGGLTLSFPAFDPPADVDTPDYYISSWQASFLALQESLLPDLYPRASAADWIASFELSYARRPALAQRLGLPHPPSRLLDGAYLPEGGELVYGLENRSILPANSGQPINGFLEVFPGTEVSRIHSAIIFQERCWLTQYSSQGMQPVYQGPIYRLTPASLQPVFTSAAAEWGLANLVFLLDGKAASLLQVRFDVEPALHPAHYPSFAEAVIDFASHSHD